MLIWLTRGKSNRDIGEILGLSPRAVNKHLEQIYAKLGIENRSSAVVLTLHALATQGRHFVARTGPYWRRPPASDASLRPTRLAASGLSQ